MSSAEVPPTESARRSSATSSQVDPAPVRAVHDSRSRQSPAREPQSEDDRQRLARRLHDDLGQRLAALQLDLGVLHDRAADVGDASLTEGIAHVASRLAQAVAVVRDLADDWRPVALDDLGLNEAIDALARRSAQRMGIEVTLRCDEQDPPLPPELAALLYRCAQEALRNVAQHAQATDVAIELFWDDAQVRLEVRDNGVGPTTGHLPAGAALEGLGMRVGAFGGQLTLQPTPGSGACLSVRVPCGFEGHPAP